MSTTTSVIHIFLASPNDLERERRMARDVVEELNRTLAKEADTFLVLLGWEDTLPGAGRPQHLINEDVHKCDLFVGVLWKRWGTPSGDLSSGFEEEFTLAHGRHRDTGLPEIWLAFKKVPLDQLGDPGEQLQKVVAFREGIERSRSLLYKEFETSEEWVGQLRTWLSTLLVRRALRRAPRPQGDMAQVPSPPTEEESDAPKLQGIQRLDDSLVLALSTLSETLTTPTEQRLGQALTDLSQVGIIRLTLALRAETAQRLTADTLTVHELNLAFCNRSEITLSVVERDLVLRTMVEDDSDLHPGWFWLGTLGTPQIVALVLRILAQDGSASVRGGAAHFLKNLRPQAPPAEELSSLLSSPHPDFVDAFIEWLEEVGGEEHESILEEIAARNPDRRARVDQALLAKRIRRDPNSATGALAQMTDVPQQLRAVLSRSVNDLDRPALNVLVAASSSWVRHLAAAELLRRGVLAPDVARTLSEDKAARVREVGVLGLVAIGQITDLDEIRRILKEEKAGGPTGLLAFSTDTERASPDSAITMALSLAPRDEVAARVDWLSLDGPKAFHELLIRDWPKMRGELLGGLEAGFAGIREASLAALERRFGSEGRNHLERSYGELDSFAGEGFLLEALRAVAPREPQLVLPWARQVIERKGGVLRNDLSEVASEVLAKVGSSEDVPRLLDAVPNLYGQGRDAAIRAALSLASDEQRRDLLFGSARPEVVVAAILSLTQHQAQDDEAFLVSSLRSDDIQIRQASLVVLERIYSRAEVEGLLEEYVLQGYYYYNVVTWLDRVLYAPAELREVYRTTLAQSGT